jgi:hypothetical protein
MEFDEIIEYSYPDFLIKDIEKPYLTETENFNQDWILLSSKKIILPSFADINDNQIQLILTKQLIERLTIPSNFHPIELFRLNKSLEMCNISDGFITQVKNIDNKYINKYLYRLKIKINPIITLDIPISSQDDYFQVLEDSNMRGLHLFVIKGNESSFNEMNLLYYISSEYIHQKIDLIEEIDIYLSTYFKSRQIPFLKNNKKIKNYDFFIKLTKLNDDPSILNKFQIEDTLNTQLYPYQRKTIKWMSEIEEKVFENTLNFQIGYFSEMGHININNINNINNQEYFYHSIENKIYNQNTLYKSDYYYTVKLFGGILSELDDVLNRISMIYFLLSKQRNSKYPSTGNNLIITNLKSISLWRKDVDRIIGISNKIITISSQKDYLKINNNLEQLTQYEFVIVSTSIIKNIKLDSIWWNRIIIDIGHDNLTQYYSTPNDLYGSGRKIRHNGLDFTEYYCNYRWIITHQPFKDGICNFEAYLQFLSGTDNLIKIAYNLSTDEIKNIIEQFFYRSDLVSILSKPNHTIEYKYVDLDIVHKLIYNKAIINNTKNEKLLNIATYITPSDFNKSIYNEIFINHKILSLNQLLKNFKYSLKSTLLNTQYSKYNNNNNIDNTNIDDVHKKIKMLDEHYFEKKIEEPCCICYLPFDIVVITKCWHLICGNCFKILMLSDTQFKCPYCRTNINNNDISVFRVGLDKIDDYIFLKKFKKYGAKITQIINDLHDIFDNSKSSDKKRIIITSPYNEFLENLYIILKEENFNSILFNGSLNDINSQIKTYDWSLSNYMNNSIILLPHHQIPFGKDDIIEISHIFITSPIILEGNHINKDDTSIISRCKSFNNDPNVPIIVYKYISKETIEEKL